jgi:hypothetical protein
LRQHRLSEDFSKKKLEPMKKMNIRKPTLRNHDEIETKLNTFEESIQKLGDLTSTLQKVSSFLSNKF